MGTHWITIQHHHTAQKSAKLVSNKELTISDLDIKPKDVEQAMEKWLWRYRDGGQFAKAK